ncbi:hypothetical protein [Sphingobacterium corticibacter]|uniref:Uncharacterized protein n=1 Tax=Sphingobacterium corticibacter TaxID=2171749 RepID=A0A2T8HI42_9SPHI|nr:hypothetical protein [Sphingobacterium corticibacter]PVH24992.1 hypothetical protein DC487_12855 [Sphingobacterium corticibacter]
MKKLKSKSRTLILASILCLCGLSIINLGFSRFTDHNEKLTSRFNLSKTDAQSLFRQIMFSKGEIVDFVPILQDRNEKLNKLDKKAILEIARIEDFVVSRIMTTNVNFFHEFKEAMISKNHLSIKEKLIESRDLIIDAGKYLNPLPSASLDTYENLKNEANSNELTNPLFGKIRSEECFRPESTTQPFAGEAGLSFVYDSVVVVTSVFFLEQEMEVMALDSKPLELDQLVKSITNI